MKKILLTFFCILFAFHAGAQDFGSLFLEKYGNDKNLEVVNIGKTMISLVHDMAPDANTQRALEGLDNIRIITADSTSGNKYFKFAYEMLTKKNSGFQSLMSMKEDGKNICIMVKESSDGVIEDLVLLNKEEKNFNLICLSGDNIDLKVLAKLSKKIKIKALERLNEIEETTDK